MHHCLEVEEILSNIFSLLAIPESIKQNRPDLEQREVYCNVLVSCALVCKTFSEPALAQLWYKQWGIGNLIKTMPRDLWTQGRSANLIEGSGPFYRHHPSSELLVSQDFHYTL